MKISLTAREHTQYNDDMATTIATVTENGIALP
jgi:hypothetical protein